jgi:hypothetical protein
VIPPQKAPSAQLPTTGQGGSIKSPVPSKIITTPPVAGVSKKPIAVSTSTIAATTKTKAKTPIRTATMPIANKPYDAHVGPIPIPDFVTVTVLQILSIFGIK